MRDTTHKPVQRTDIRTLTTTHHRKLVCKLPLPQEGTMERCAAKSYNHQPHIDAQNTRGYSARLCNSIDGVQDHGQVGESVHKLGNVVRVDVVQLAPVDRRRDRPMVSSAPTYVYLQPCFWPSIRRWSKTLPMMSVVADVNCLYSVLNSCSSRQPKHVTGTPRISAQIICYNAMHAPRPPCQATSSQTNRLLARLPDCSPPRYRR